MELFKKYFTRKFIPLLALTGSLTAITICALHLTNKNLSIMVQSILVFAFILVGIISGVIASITYEKKGKDVLTYNYLDKATVFSQKIYLITPIAMVVAFFIGFQTSIAMGVVSAIFLGFAYMMGLAAGIFDYHTILTQQMLNTGVFPIMLSFAYAYYAVGSDLFITFVWVFGSVYLYSYLLFVNRLRLNKIMFFRNSVNVENSKNIRVFNDLLLTGFFGLFLVFFNFRKMIEFSYEFIGAMLVLFFNFLASLTENLLVITDVPQIETTDDLGKFFAGGQVEQSLLTKIIIIVVFIIFLVGIGILIFMGVRAIVRAIKKLVNNMVGTGNKKTKDSKIQTKEYEEESEIIKDENQRETIRRSRKNIYSLKGLELLNNDQEKLRYLYGFALERLYIQHVDFNNSDTPIQILDAIAENKGGLELNEKQFIKFTNEYRRVRYGYKPSMAMDYIKEAKELEKKISELKVKIKTEK